jgi:ABC-type spermidine/putrescine transport system permease subunit I
MRWALGAPLLLVYLAFLLVPILDLVATSLTPFRRSGSLTLENYRQFFEHTFYLRSLYNTMWIAAAVTLVAVLLAYPAAYYLASRARARRAVVMAIIAPVFTAGIIRIYGWTLIMMPTSGVIAHVPGLQDVQLLYTPYGVIIGLSALLLPVTTLPIYANLVALDPALLLAARGLGASRVRTVLTILIPLTRTGLFSSVALAFILASTNVGATVILGGQQLATVPNYLYEQYFTTFDRPLSSAMAIILVTVITIIGGLMVGLGRERPRRGAGTQVAETRSEPAA